MKQVSILLLAFLLVPILIFSQLDNANWLIRKFKSADTILLISHKVVAGATDVYVDSKGNQIPLPKLIIKGKVNQDIITEKLSLNSNQIDTLLQILKRPDLDSVVSQGGCFVPRQSIILIKKNRTSYIDICFHCESYVTSKDLNKIPPFDNRRWTELEIYFRNHGLTYELDNR